MEIQVKITRILEPSKFKSTKNGNEYIKNQFVGETAGQYPKQIAFGVLGDDKFKQMNIVVGGTYNISFDVESREWQGKFFTECQAWRAVRIDGQQAAPAANNGDTTGNAPSAPAPRTAPEVQPQQESTGDKADDLPF